MSLHPPHPPGGPIADVHRLHPVIHRHRREMLHTDPDKLLRERELKMRKHHEKMLWAPLAVLALGLWLMTTPAIYTYDRLALARSDLIVGALLVLFGALSLSADRLWAPWTCAGIGVWLLLAPLIFWTRSPSLYSTDTLIGAAVIAFSVLIPGVPGSVLLALRGPEVPSGWSYNPSSWWQRAPVILLAVVGFLLARYLAAFELGQIPSVWDPLFKGATQKLLDTGVFRRWPLPVTGLASVAFLTQILTGFMGGTSRWRTMPWLVLGSCLVTLVLAITSWVALILQPALAGTWALLPLLCAGTSLLMLPFGFDEGVATLKFLSESNAAGKRVLRVFWLGGTVGQVAADRRTPRGNDLRRALPAMTWGVSFPWNLCAALFIGVVFLTLPGSGKFSHGLSQSLYWGGGLAFLVTITALAEIARPISRLNFGVGVWLMIAPWIYGPGPLAPRILISLMALFLIVLTYRRAPIREHYGTLEMAFL